jgi:hypothetical protein
VSEFGRAYRINGLTVPEFGHYGPVEYFRQMLIEAWRNALDMIKTVRAQQQP